MFAIVETNKITTAIIKAEINNEDKLPTKSIFCPFLLKGNCSLNSYLYTNTQEQYIDILYDELNPKNVVYYVNNGK